MCQNLQKFKKTSDTAEYTWDKLIFLLSLVNNIVHVKKKIKKIREIQNIQCNKLENLKTFITIWQTLWAESVQRQQSILLRYEICKQKPAAFVLGAKPNSQTIHSTHSSLLVLKKDTIQKCSWTRLAAKLQLGNFNCTPK